ncbi:MAG: phosphopentomutase [bacterium]|nr:phosphopentomutase [bacterium]
MRWIQIILDGVGVGDAPDAGRFGDEGSNTLGNLSEYIPLHLPNLQSLGLGCLTKIHGVEPVSARNVYGSLTEKSDGKDSTSGHWELAGLVTSTPFPYFYEGFPETVLHEIRRVSGRGILGNKAASGTEIIKELGEQHVTTGDLIVYTSADSVLQIAAHEAIVPLPELYRICRELRQLWMTGPYAVGRIIARPFLGDPGSFYRTPNRHDESLPPHGETIIDRLKTVGIPTASVGKVSDLFAQQGFTEFHLTKSNDEGVQAILQWMRSGKTGFLFANLVDFDMLYGHRNDKEGFAAALEQFDKQLPEILALLGKQDILAITADHGNDPTTPSTDHSRERVPLLLVGSMLKNDFNIGVRASFADLGASVVEAFQLSNWHEGKSFWQEILR